MVDRLLERVRTRADGVVAGCRVVVDGAGRVRCAEDGGIVGGQSYSGDNVTARVNSGELILNRAQQNNLAGQMSNISVRVVSINEDAMYKELYQASKDGRLMISDRSLVSI